MSEWLTSRKVMSRLGLSLILGLGLGVVLEADENEKAKGRIVTAETCLEIVPHETQVTADLRACFNKGVLGGKPIPEETFRVRDPIAVVGSYIAGERQEAASIEPVGVLVWAVSPVFMAGLVMYARDMEQNQ